MSPVSPAGRAGRPAAQNPDRQLQGAGPQESHARSVGTDPVRPGSPGTLMRSKADKRDHDRGNERARESMNGAGILPGMLGWKVEPFPPDDRRAARAGLPIRRG